MFSGFKRVLTLNSDLSHNPTSPPSTKALSLLRSSLSSPYPSGKANAPPLHFNLEVIESPPTSDQLRTISSFLPKSSPSSFLSAHPSTASETPNISEIVGLAKKNPNTFKWPIVVDWAAGKASVGDVEGVKEILENLRKQRDGEAKGEEVDQPKGWFS
ncbi:hypothetical protein EYR38_009737 [Pleurotus pulmonarius]|nr:hypothetical protein EYR38_009737 [Pleurotus pulmonarius]